MTSNDHYADDASGDDEFKKMFKKYRAYDNRMYEEVYDFNQIERFPNIVKLDHEMNLDARNLHEYSDLLEDLSDPREWCLYTVKDFHRGLLFIPNVFKRHSSRKWFNFLLNELPFKYKNEFKYNCDLNSMVDLFKLRWITFGYHHDWNTKVYDEQARSPVPDELERLFKLISILLNVQFTPEAGIINYYTSKSRISPHNDLSERDLTRPLFSLSLGNDSIFLIGGRTRDQLPIIPLWLRDSDLIIMSEECRYSVHAIPKVVANRGEKADEVVRINLNVRQVN